MRPVARAPLINGPAHACAGCGAGHACLGIGPPLVAVLQWFCGVCWARQPSTQTMLADRCAAALDEGDGR